MDVLTQSIIILKLLTKLLDPFCVLINVCFYRAFIMIEIFVLRNNFDFFIIIITNIPSSGYRISRFHFYKAFHLSIDLNGLPVRLYMKSRLHYYPAQFVHKTV